MAADPYAGVAQSVQTAPEDPYSGVAQAVAPESQAAVVDEESRFGSIHAYDPSIADRVKDTFNAAFNQIPTAPRHAEGVRPDWSDVPDAIIGIPIRALVQPGSLAAMASGAALPALAGRAIGMGFGAYGAYQAGEAAPRTLQTITDPNTSGPEKAMAAGNELINVAMAALPIGHMAHEAGTIQANKTFPLKPVTVVPGYQPTEETPLPPTTVKPADSPAADPYAGVAERSAQAPAPQAPAEPDPYEGVAQQAMPAEATPQESVSGPDPYAGIAEPSESPPEATDAGDNTHGIAARVSAARAESGDIEPIEPGQGISTVSGLERGRDLLSKGSDPYEILRNFGDTGRLSSDDFAVLRAQGESLAKAASDAAIQKGIKSPEYEAARQADSDFTEAIKPLQTEWARMGMLQQGEVDLDTGDFHSLNKAHQDATGNPFTEDQAEQAQGIAERVTQARAEADTAQQAVFDFINEMPRSFKDVDVQQVWDLAKQYLESGETDFDNIRAKISADTGLPIEDVTEKLTLPKSGKALTDDMYAKMSMRRQMVQDAKNWLQAQQMSTLKKLATNIPAAFFTAKTAGHGTVGMITHAALNAFDPVAWGNYFQRFADQYPLMLNPAFHEMKMQELVRDPNFIKARRAGLANDPRRLVDDYQSTWAGNMVRKLGLSGNHGFDALKLFRQDAFNKFWDQLPKNAQTPEMAKMLAASINHSTGIVSTKLPGWVDKALFAPKLEASRWAWLIGDPAKAVEITSRWNSKTNPPSEAEKAFATREFATKARIAGVYAGLLAFNEAMLKMAGSNQSINYTDPRRADFMAFKGMGYKVQPMAPLLGLVRLLANEIHAVATPARHGSTTYEDMGRIAVDYGRGKLSPVAGVATDAVTGADIFGRPLPYSNQKVPKQLARQGVGKYTYTDYADQNLSPIPVGEVAKQLNEMGMTKDKTERFIGAIVSGLVMAGTGIRVSRDTSPPQRAR